MRYHIHCTINTERSEYEYDTTSQDSIDMVMSRILEQHPSCTSVLMAIVPDTKVYPTTFQAERG